MTTHERLTPAQVRSFRDLALYVEQNMERIVVATPHGKRTLASLPTTEAVPHALRIVARGALPLLLEEDLRHAV